MKDTEVKDIENSGEVTTLELAFVYKVCAKNIRKYVLIK